MGQGKLLIQILELTDQLLLLGQLVSKSSDLKLESNHKHAFKKSKKLLLFRDLKNIDKHTKLAVIPQIKTCFWCASLSWSICSSRATRIFVAASFSSAFSLLVTACTCSAAFSLAHSSRNASTSSSRARLRASASFIDSVSVCIRASCCEINSRLSAKSFSYSETYKAHIYIHKTKINRRKDTDEPSLTFLLQSTWKLSNPWHRCTKFFTSDFILLINSRATVNSSSSLPLLSGGAILNSKSQLTKSWSKHNYGIISYLHFFILFPEIYSIYSYF